MALRDKLQIYIVTYNRLKKLRYTLNELLKSPVKDFDITVLDNASTDGTSEMLDNYSNNYSNIKHIRHKVNIGGNANICRAFEMAATCGKEYFWVLCDDDKYDFSNWKEVEKHLEIKDEIICVADYIYNSLKERQNPAYQFFQLTFVPAGIYRVDIIDDDILINMYNSIYTMMQQCCLTARVLNTKGRIHVLSKPIVFNGLHYRDAESDNAYNRGASSKQEQLKRCKENLWIMGYSNILSLLNNKQLAQKSFEAAIVNKDVYTNFDNFYFCLNSQILEKGNFNYFYEIYSMLPNKRRVEVIKNRKREILLLLKKEGILSEFCGEKVRKDILKTLFSVADTPDGRHKKIKLCGINLNIRKTDFCGSMRT